MPIRAACLTMMKDEPFFLMLWYDYYSRQLGVENMFVIDHGSEWKTGKPSEVTAILDAVNVIRIPYTEGAGALKSRGFDFTRFQLINSIVSGLRAYYDVVLYNDIDEITVANPAKWYGLYEYLEHVSPCNSIMAGVGMEIYQNIECERPFSHNQPLFAQRKNYTYYLHYSKPNVFFANGRTGPHKCYQPFILDPDLYHFHLKYIDKDQILGRQDAMLEHREQGRGAVRSRWSWSKARLEKEFTRLARRPLDPSREFLHPAVFERDLPKADCGYAIDARGDDYRYWVCNSLNHDSIAVLESGRHELPIRFADLEL